MIDIAKYTGVDDSKCKIKLGMADEIIIDEWANGGMLCAVRYVRISKEEYDQNIKEIIEIATRVADEVYDRDCEAYLKSLEAPKEVSGA